MSGFVCAVHRNKASDGRLHKRKGHRWIGIGSAVNTEGDAMILVRFRPVRLNPFAEAMAQEFDFLTAG